MASVSHVNQENSTKKLHYIYDPLCGWCYGIAPLIEVVSHEYPHVLTLHGGGLFTPTRKVTGGDAWKEHVTPIDERISQLSGQIFSQQYRNNLANTEMTLNSLMPIAAILVARKMGDRDVMLLKALQDAYYLDGLNISDKDVLFFIVQKLGFDITLFSTLFTQVNEYEITQHIQQTQQLMHQVNGRGFPTLCIEDNQTYHLIPVENYFGDTKSWTSFLKQRL